MSENDWKKNAETIHCPSCERDWPVVSEQGIVCELYGQCYACLINGVITIRDERMEEAEYRIDNCPDCISVPGAREKCIPRGGKGWVVLPKSEEPRIQLINP